jgi:hypothetical protein
VTPQTQQLIKLLYEMAQQFAEIEDNQKQLYNEKQAKKEEKL